jgi:hypothetical protein
MPDVTAEFLSDYSPLPSSVDGILIYSEELDDEGKHINFQWATREIKQHMLNWARAGLVAFKVKLYRLYSRSFKTFQDYCEKVLGKTAWQINRLIKAAQVTLELVKAGFTVLPTCEAQASKLVKYIQHPEYGYDELLDKWQQVIDSLPAHRITANAIEEILEPARPKKEAIRLPKSLLAKLRRRALDEGVSVEELLEDFIDEGEPEEEIEPISRNAIERPEKDLEELVEQHDAAIWFFGTMMRSFWRDIKVLQRECNLYNREISRIANIAG